MDLPKALYGRFRAEPKKSKDGRSAVLGLGEAFAQATPATILGNDRPNAIIRSANLEFVNVTRSSFPFDTSSRKRKYDADVEETIKKNMVPEPTTPPDNAAQEQRPCKRRRSRAVRSRVVVTVVENRPTSLRMNRLVRAEVPFDIWVGILAYCPPGFLVKARQINRQFRHALSYERPWILSRLHTYGPGCPRPPLGINEMQYADLLDGMGCQSKNCKDTKGRKTYWAFLRRWCESCFLQKVDTQKAIQSLANRHGGLLSIMPHCTISEWKKYAHAGSYDRPNRPSWVKSVGTSQGFERRAIGQAIEDIELLRASNPSAEEDSAWFESKRVECEIITRDLQKVEDFIESSKRDKTFRNKVKQDRIDYFKRKASEMDPPLASEALELIEPYKKSVSINRPPSLRCWVTLSHKLQNHRVLAEEILASNNCPDVNEEPDRSSKIDHRFYKQLRESSAPTLPVLQLLVEIAGTIINEYKCAIKPFRLSDEDWIPLVLKDVRITFNKSTDTRKLAHDHLILEDARFLVKECIMPMINSWQDPHRETRATQFKCPICNKRKDSMCRRSFEGIISHIIQVHSESTIGDFWSWRKRNRADAQDDFYRLPWPSNLPLLMENHEATGRWDLHDESDYVRAPVIYPSEASDDAFEGRQVTTEEGPALGDIAGNILFAVTLFKGTGLDPKLITLAGFDFARKRHAILEQEDSTQTIAQLTKLQEELIIRGYNDVFDGFRCGWCHAQRQKLKHTEKEQKLGDLVAHYSSSICHPPNQWMKCLFLLPHPGQLTLALRANATAQAVFDRLFPLRTSAVPTDEAFIFPANETFYVPDILYPPILQTYYTAYHY